MCETACITCATCSVAFHIPKEMERQRLEDREHFYCPYGHANVFLGKSEAEKLRDKVAHLERRLEWLQGDLQRSRLEVERQEMTIRGLRGTIGRARRDPTFLRPPEPSVEIVA